jgi:hypothetical protein
MMCRAGVKPQTLEVRPEGIPGRLRQCEQWVCWRWHWRPDDKAGGRWTKMPIDCGTGSPASSTDPATWGPFDEALTYHQANRSTTDGVGFMFRKGGGYVGFDLDEAVGPDGCLKEWADDLVSRLGSYTETSPTGTGVKVYLRGSCPGKEHRRQFEDGEVEVYDRGRFFCVTGHRLDWTPGDVLDQPSAINDVYRLVYSGDDALAPDVMGDAAAASGQLTISIPVGTPDLSDEELIRRALAAKNGEKFRRLWAGDTTGYQNDDSRADLALCGLLAFWTGPDLSRIDRLFRQSKLMRPKWDERRGEVTYGQHTIQAALAGRTDFQRSTTDKTTTKRGASKKPNLADTEPVGLATIRLSSVRPRPVRWLVPGLLPLGKLALLAGDGGHGKSTLTLDVTAAVTTGRSFFAAFENTLAPSDVLLISCEDDVADTIVPRLLSAGADLNRIQKVEGIKGKDDKTIPFCLAHYQAMEAHLAANPSIRLVVIDPAGAFIGRSGVDDYNDTELRSLLGPMAELAARREVTILLIKHLVKGATTKAVHKVGGSTGYVNAVRAAFVIAPDGDDSDKKLFLPLKFNLGPRPSGLAYRMRSLEPYEQQRILDGYCAHLDAQDRDRLAKQLFRIEWLGPVDADADRVLGEQARRDRGLNKVERAMEWLTAFLATYAYPSDEIRAAAKAEGFTFDNLKEAKARLKEKGLHNSNKGQFGGVWWSGFGAPESWVLRPSTPDNPHNPHNGQPVGDAGERAPEADPGRSSHSTTEHSNTSAFTATAWGTPAHDAGEAPSIVVNVGSVGSGGSGHLEEGEL